MSRKPKNKAQLDSEADKRLRKTYNISLKDYGKLAGIYNQGCWNCGLVPEARRLHVDHDHSINKLKIEAKKLGANWVAETYYLGERISSDWVPKRAMAVRQVKDQLKRLSVRGLLCWPHNKLLAIARDNPDVLRNAAQYLDNFQSGKTREMLGAV